MNFRLQIEACNNKTRSTCKQLEEIEEYINDLNVEHWVLEETIDWGKYG